MLTVYHLYDSINGEVKLNPAKVEAFPAIEAVTSVPTRPQGTIGIVIRANSDEVDVKRLEGTDVTDVVITLGSKDASATIKALRSAGINVHISVPANNAIALANNALQKYDVNGIEVDFVGDGLYERFIGDSYNAIDNNTDMLESLNAKLSVYEANYGHSVEVAVRVPANVTDSFEAGLNVTDWALKGWREICNILLTKAAISVIMEMICIPLVIVLLSKSVKIQRNFLSQSC